jgi:hypothetical protein
MPPPELLIVLFLFRSLSTSSPLSFRPNRATTLPSILASVDISADGDDDSGDDDGGDDDGGDDDGGNDDGESLSTTTPRS